MAVARIFLNFHGPRVFQFYSYLMGIVSIGAMGFTLAQMHQHKELVAIMASGVSLFRVAVPSYNHHSRPAYRAILLPQNHSRLNSPIWHPSVVRSPRSSRLRNGRSSQPRKRHKMTIPSRPSKSFGTSNC